MNYFLTQLILAARSNDTDGSNWTQLLVLVILAVFYALGTIVKSKANKAEQQPEQPEGPGDMPIQSRRTPHRHLQRREVTRPKPQLAVRKFAAPTPAPTIQLRAIKPSPAPELSLRTPKLEPALEELPEFTRKLTTKLKSQELSILSPKPVTQPVSLQQLLLDYADPDDLKRAILHYEILGKPLSLREPSEQLISY